MGFLLYCPTCYQFLGKPFVVGSLTDSGAIEILRHVPPGEASNWYKTAVSFENGTVYCSACNDPVLKRANGTQVTATMVGGKISLIATPGSQ